MKNGFSNLLVSAIAGGALFALVSHLLFASGTATFVAALIGGTLGFCLDYFDPLHRYRRAFYDTTIVSEFSGRPLGRARCVVLIIEETEGYYRLRFPLWWKLSYTHPTWVAKHHVRMIG